MSWRTATSGSTRLRGNHEEQVIKDLLKKVFAEDTQALAQSGQGLARRVGRDDHGRAPALQDDGAGQAAGAGHQRERLGDQVEVRQPLRLPRVAGRRHQARDGRDGGGQGCGHLRLRRRGQGLVALAARHGRARGGHGDRPHQRAAGGDGRLRGRRPSKTRWAAATSTSPARATPTSSRSSTCRR